MKREREKKNQETPKCHSGVSLPAASRWLSPWNLVLYHLWPKSCRKLLATFKTPTCHLAIYKDFHHRLDFAHRCTITQPVSLPWGDSATASRATSLSWLLSLFVWSSDSDLKTGGVICDRSWKVTASHGTLICVCACVGFFSLMFLSPLGFSVQTQWMSLLSDCAWLSLSHRHT